MKNSQPEIITGDSLEVLRTFAAESVDLVIADPPYNLGKNYGNNHDLKGFEEYLDFSRAWLSEAQRILKPTGTIYVFMGVRFVSYLYDMLDQELGMFFNSWITWHYTQGMGRTKGFSPRHDDVLMFNKTEQFKFHLDEVRVPQKYFRKRNNMAGANPGDVWQFSHVHYSNPERQDHPTQKPELSPNMQKEGGNYYIIPEKSHRQLEQGYVILKNAKDNTTATKFASFVDSKPAKEILSYFGFAQKIK